MGKETKMRARKASRARAGLKSGRGVGKKEWRTWERGAGAASVAALPAERGRGRLEKKEMTGRPNLSADERGEGEGMAGWASVQEEKGGCAGWIGPCTPKEREGEKDFPFLFSKSIFQTHFQTKI